MRTLQIKGEFFTPFICFFLYLLLYNKNDIISAYLGGNLGLIIGLN
ncbi:hypothetical protein SAMN00017405_1444 [Desulfonispora thiosulfatigenes DSM 11270]|uniref:Uncharacterized protein n=1 Tax=Desulfonispora thiosulfatigenes DSM 11270 TaxID=656914 RepID=A0A1W1VRM7_DESTI|nr:hypothetical protein SAMN00017405_1444 [Desulfonispora thiosulfatigenes DSM 11270]